MSFEINHILDKALELFNKYGIRSVSMDDIAGEMGISKKTLYQNFRDKNELVDHVELYRHDLRKKQFDALFSQKLPAIDELLAFHNLIELFIMHYSKAFEYDLKKYYHILYQDRYEQRKRSMIEALRNNLNKGIHEGVYRTDIYIETLAHYETTFIQFMVESNSHEKIDSEDIKYFNEIFKIHLYGILSEKGKDLYLKKKLKNQ